MDASTASDGAAARVASELRPQVFGRTGPDRIREPVVEPAWPGQRLIAGVDGDAAVLFADGVAVPGQERICWHLAHQLGASADSVVVDGYLTKQVADDDGGIYTGTDALPSTGKLIAQSMVGVRRNRADEAAEAREAELAARTFTRDDPVNLVVTDLLWLDGQSLLDVPLLERLRLLDSLLPGDELVRPGVFVRPPLATWIGSWRAQGFTGITFKEANSRYQSGATAADWATSAMPRR
jgi:hypothetical protein